MRHIPFIYTPDNIVMSISKSAILCIAKCAIF